MNRGPVCWGIGSEQNKDKNIRQAHDEPIQRFHVVCHWCQAIGWPGGTLAIGWQERSQQLLFHLCRLAIGWQVAKKLYHYLKACQIATVVYFRQHPLVFKYRYSNYSSDSDARFTASEGNEVAHSSRGRRISYSEPRQ